MSKQETFGDFPKFLSPLVFVRYFYVAVWTVLHVTGPNSYSLTCMYVFVRVYACVCV